MGYSSGGYTGDGGMFEPAGVVHGREYVFNAADTKRIGVNNLQALSAGAIPQSMRGSSGTTNKYDVNVNISMAPGGSVDKRTQNQIALAVNKGLSGARRNS